MVLYQQSIDLLQRNQILPEYGPKKYGAIAGDGGPNVCVLKRELATTYPWILNIYDPSHNLNLFLKDIGKLFKDVRHWGIMLFPC